MCGWHFTCECHAHISQEIHDFLKRQRRSEPPHSPRVYDTLPQLRARALDRYLSDSVLCERQVRRAERGVAL